MLKNYFKVALRNLSKHKAYSLINLLGLAIGLSCCILIALYIIDELNFDRFHANWRRIYRVVETQSSPDLGERQYGITVAPLAPTLTAEFPEIQDAARLIELGRMTVQRGENRSYEEYIGVDPNLFEIFDFEFLRGDASALHEPYTCVLTEDMATKYFGVENPIGQVLQTDREETGFKVAAVLKNIPLNSHLQFGMMVSLATVQASARFGAYMSRWDVEGFQTYVLLNESNAPAQVEAKLPALLKQHQPEKVEVEKKLSLQPLADIHFHSENIEFEMNDNKSNILYVYVFGAIALFVILIACINYMNLATARSINRASEVGLRKVVGARKRQLMGQFLSESLLITLMALLVAYAVVQNILPVFNAFTGKALALDSIDNVPVVLCLTALAFLVGIISGSYPAFYLSNIHVINVLKSRHAAGSTTSALRRGLVVTQFVLSIVLIVATLVALKQMDYIRSKELGFDRERLAVIDINSRDARGSFQAMREEFLLSPNVENVSVTSRVPGEWKSLREIEAVPDGSNESAARTMHLFGVDRHFLETFEVSLISGRNFQQTMATDTMAVLLNEAAVAAFGWDTPIGKTFTVPGRDYRAHVIGVVRNFHFRSLHEKIGPLVLGHSHNPIQNIDYFTAKISGSNIDETLKHLQAVHEKYDITTPFEYHFLDAQIEEFYRQDQRMSALFGMTGGLAIFIACLGLFGLAAFTAEQRTKEIGIRKVMGASIRQIVVLLSGEFTRLVAMALLLATPIAFYIMTKWLDGFAYHTDIGVVTFAYAGLLALTIAWLTVGVQAVKAAISNPIDSLRHE